MIVPTPGPSAIVAFVGSLRVTVNVSSSSSSRSLVIGTVIVWVVRPGREVQRPAPARVVRAARRRPVGHRVVHAHRQAARRAQGHREGRRPGGFIHRHVVDATASACASLSMIVPMPVPSAIVAFVGPAQVDRERLVQFVERVVEDRHRDRLLSSPSRKAQRPAPRGVIQRARPSPFGHRVAHGHRQPARRAQVTVNVAVPAASFTVTSSIAQRRRRVVVQ